MNLIIENFDWIHSQTNVELIKSFSILKQIEFYSAKIYEYLRIFLNYKMKVVLLTYVQFLEVSSTLVTVFVL